MATDIAGTHPATILEVKGIYSGGEEQIASPPYVRALLAIIHRGP